MSRRRRLTADEAEISRREFVRTAACAAVGTTALVSTVWDLRLMNAAIAQSTTGFSDYKALVCVFLNGGNDANNMLVPLPADPAYADYATYRGALALPNDFPTHNGGNTALNGSTAADANNAARTWGLHPAMQGVADLCNTGKAVVVGNVGTLVAPITKAQWAANPRVVPIPSQLFSHADQQVQWQTSFSDVVSPTGWGGRCADLLMSSAYGANPGTAVSMNITVGGVSTFEVGANVNPYTVSATGSITNFSAASTARLNALKALFNDGINHPNLFDQAFAQTMKRADDNAAIMGNVFNNAVNPAITTTFPATTLGNQLKTIARIIKGRGITGHNRQIFFANITGYDLHTGQFGNAANPADTTIGSHANLLSELSATLTAFYNCMNTELGLGDKVTAFSVSDFGRTFPTNSGGSDHGWGNHQIVVGGAVNGWGSANNQIIYGNMPRLQTGGPDDTSSGRWIPTTAVDEFSATLARWFGVGNSDLYNIFPNLGRFAHPDLGFMNLA
jgi:uncharacterized protein (DUF1501 family)